MFNLEVYVRAVSKTASTSTVADVSSANSFTASDVKEAAGLSYRQLNDWESKGALTSSREAKAAWRKFSMEEVYALRVCSDLRKRIPLPLRAIGRLFTWLMTGSAIPKEHKELWVKLVLKEAEENPEFAPLFKNDEMRRELELMAWERTEEKVSRVRLAAETAAEGQPVYLFTNLESHLILPEAMLEQMVSTRLHRRPTIIFMLNESLNEVRKKLKCKPYAFHEYSVEELMRVMMNPRVKRKGREMRVGKNP